MGYDARNYRGRGGRGYGRGHGGGGRGNRTYPDKVRAPYNFVPLSSKVVFPEWADMVSHDVPFSDGVSGTLDVRITAETPIFVRGTESKQEFFKLPNGIYAIPGTSIRGMLRNVVEIATFSKMSRVNEHRFGVRDLHNRQVYGKHMAAIVQGKPVPLVCAGWLSLDGGKPYDEDDEKRWKITPCHFAKIEYKLLKDIARKKGISGFNPGRKQSAPDKYRKWGDDLSIECNVHEYPRAVAGVHFHGNYGVVNEKGGNRVKGTIVFTGQPSNYDPGKLRNKGRGAGNPKHHDFVFYGGAGNPLDVPWSIRKDFSFVHSAGGEQHRLDSDPNTEWKFMLKRLKAGKEVPVFYLLNSNGKLRSFGLAMMFRLAYKKTTKDTVLKAQPNADSFRLDMAELLFGRVRDSEDDKKNRGLPASLRGRVSIEPAVCEGSPNKAKKVTGVLGAPKASYYPSYLVQGRAPGDNPFRGSDGKPSYITYQDDSAKARGWKRYPQRTNVVKPPPPPKKGDGSINYDVATTFVPLASGTTFFTRIHVHNLRPVELGSLLWAIDFGGRKECRHGLGLAKAFGYGGVKLEIMEGKLYTNNNRSGADLPMIVDDSLEKFKSYMEAKLELGWEKSIQIHQLVSMAIPVDAKDDKDLRHMLISHPEYRNEFQGVKSVGLALKLWDKPKSYSQWKNEVKPAEPGNYAPASASGSSGRVSTATQSPNMGHSDGEDVVENDEPDDPILAEAKKAHSESQHLKLFRAWMDEKGPLEKDRRKAAIKVVGNPSRKWRARNKDIWDWMKGE
ncbi:MAG: TIGR03986 family CRISPR-associated RAMP protein [Deltaproteobacteria bacterium]|nr:TIGR03986 family CRISPR-associated RAMP protein [Deltaproteobacteria bacterium]